MVSSMSLVLTVSTVTRELSTLLSWMLARVMKPVRPMPPAVAQNSSGSESLVTVCGAVCSALGNRMSKLVTWLANDPATWWFLPWTSAAIAPPTVTWRVPGETGTNQPCGSPAIMSCSRETPASASTTPVAWSKLMMLFSLPLEMTMPSADCAALL
jgi:hypothetical protein